MYGKYNKYSKYLMVLHGIRKVCIAYTLKPNHTLSHLES